MKMEVWGGPDTCIECDRKVGWENLTQGGKCEECEYKEEK